MPSDPYLIAGLTYDVDDTIIGSVTIRLINIRTGESMPATSSAIGEYVEDLANLKQGYNNGDWIFVQTVKTTDNSVRFSEGKFKIDINTGYTTKNLYFNRIGVDKQLQTLSDTDILNREHDPTIKGKRVKISDEDLYVEDKVITRNASNYITSIVITKGNKKKTITITRDANNYITSIDEKVN